MSARPRLYYLATPYAKYAQGVEAAWKMACEQAALLMLESVAVFCPIAHSHPIAMFGKIESRDHVFWMAVDRPMMDACDALIIVKAPGWGKSEGMGHELATFTKANKPVIWMEPGIVPNGLNRTLPHVERIPG